MAREKRKVLITGASGLIGGLCIKHLGDEYEFSGLSRRKVGGIPHLQASIEDAEKIKPAFDGIDTVIHLGAWNTDVFDWKGTMAVTIQGTLNVYEAAREAGVRRILQASSGCTQLGLQYDDALPYGKLAQAPEAEKPTEWDMVTLDDPVRPDSPYAIGKLFGENLGRLYADLHGISTMVIRLGGVLVSDRPDVWTIYPGYLSHRDCMNMVRACIEAPDDNMFDIFNAISDNRWRWRTTDHGKTIGWEAQDSADSFPWPAEPQRA